MAAKRAAVGLQQPLEGRLDSISSPHASKIDGSATRAAFEEQPDCGADHETSPAFGTGLAGCAAGVK